MDRDQCFIFNGNCLDIMRKLPNESFHLIFTDPPYGETSYEWDMFNIDWIDQCKRLLKPEGSLWIWGSLRYILGIDTIIGDLGFRLSQDLVWEKNNGSGFSNDRFRRVHQFLVQYYCGKWSDIYKNVLYEPTGRSGSVTRSATEAGLHGKRKSVTTQLNKRIVRSVIKNKQRRGVGHPTAKPLDISEKIIRYSCPEDGFVLDPFAGSCTTAIAAVRSGCHFTMIEKDEKYFEIGSKLVQQEINSCDGMSKDQALKNF